MNFLIAFVLVATAAAGHCVPINQASPTENQIKELTAATLLFFHSALPNTSFAPLPSFVNERLRIPEIDTDVTTTGKNGMAYGINQVLLSQYEFDASTLATKFSLTSLNFTRVYDIEVEGKLFGHKVSGEGVLRQEVLGEGYYVSNLRFEEINHSLQIASLELNLLMDDVIVDVEESGFWHPSDAAIEQSEDDLLLKAADQFCLYIDTNLPPDLDNEEHTTRELLSGNELLRTADPFSYTVEENNQLHEDHSNGNVSDSPKAGPSKPRSSNDDEDLLINMESSSDSDEEPHDLNDDPLPMDSDPNSADESGALNVSSTIENNDQPAVTRQKTQNMKEINKRKRERGEEYNGRKKRGNQWDYHYRKQAKIMKPTCNCTLGRNFGSSIKCATLTEDMRQSIFQRFWKKLTWDQRKTYISTLIETEAPTNLKNRKDRNESRRSLTLRYYLKPPGYEKIRVCKKLFLNTLAITDWLVKESVERPTIEQAERPDCEGDEDEPVTSKRNKRQSAESENKMNKLRLFLQSLPKMESHYCRKNTSKLFLEPLFQAKTEVYELYQADCAEKSLPAASLKSFYCVFDEMKLALFRPRKDQCDTCVGHMEGNVTEEDYETHQKQKEQARLEKEADECGPNNSVFTMDLQAGDPTVNQLKALKYCPDGQVFYKLDFNNDWELLPKRQKKGSGASSPIMPPLYQSSLKISADKYTHLQQLKCVIAKDFHSFYDQLHH
ncbi:hypothetical protein GE061_019573 [Apolygus lucorum]|uniref:Uncharacterized protein n=1 Tax=Apolygus lucorum TaxID=248454 RepID=A0A8S9XAR3_APOLU|nr:hypothetical protein GE061_019573 [Apolygus lucorum]